MSLTVTLSVICPSPGCGWIRPSPGCGWIRPSPGCGWMLARIGRLSGFQPRVSGPRAPEAGKLRLRKELGTARKALNRLPRHHHHLLYKLQARQLQSKVLSRLENLDHQPHWRRTYSCIITSEIFVPPQGKLRSAGFYTWTGSAGTSSP